MTDLSTRVRELNNAKKKPTKNKKAIPIINTSYQEHRTAEPVLVDIPSGDAVDIMKALEHKPRITRDEIEEIMTLIGMGELLVIGVLIIATLVKALFLI